MFNIRGKKLIVMGSGRGVGLKNVTEIRKIWANVIRI